MRTRAACVISDHPADCGPAALATVALHYGLRISPLRLRILLHTDLQGTDLESLRAGAEQLGFVAASGRLQRDAVDKIATPFIAHLNEPGTGHFVVVHHADADRVRVADPADGLRTLTRDEFGRVWSGGVVLVQPGPGLRARPGQPAAFADLAAIARSQRNLLMTSAWLALVVSCLGYAMAFYLRSILDKVLPGSDLPLLRTLTIGVAVVILVRILLGVARQYALLALGIRVSASLSLEFATRLVMLPVTFFDRLRGGDALTRFLDVPKIAGAVSGALLGVVFDVVLLLACGAFMLWYSVSLTAAVLTLMVLSIGALFAAAGVVRDRERRIRARFNLVASRFSDLVTNIRVLKGHAAEHWAVERLASAYAEWQQSLVDRAKITIGLTSVSQILSGLSTICLLWWGTHLVVERRLTTGELVFFYSVFGFFLASVERLPPSVLGLQEALVATERLKDVARLPDEHTGPQLLPARGTTGYDTVALKGVTYWYRPGQPVLVDVSVDVAAGETLVIVGGSGSGKSTLLSLINGFYLPRTGAVEIGGRNIVDLDKTTLRRHAVFVPQESPMLTGTIEDNITLGMTPVRRDHIDAAIATAGVDEFLGTLPNGLAYELGAGGAGLSGGQRQRVALARALYRDPAILVLDEATSNLDVETESAIVQRLLAGRDSRITIIATHRLGIAPAADRILVLQAGRVAETGRHDELLKRRGRYADMWRQDAASRTGTRDARPHATVR